MVHSLEAEFIENFSLYLSVKTLTDFFVFLSFCHKIVSRYTLNDILRYLL